MAFVKQLSTHFIAFLRDSVIPRLNAMARFPIASPQQAAKNLRVKMRRYSIWVSKKLDLPFEMAHQDTMGWRRCFDALFDGISSLFPSLTITLKTLAASNRSLGRAVTKLFCFTQPLNFNYRVLVSLELANPREIDQFLNAIPFVCKKHVTRFNLMLQRESVPLVQSALQRLGIQEFVEVGTNLSTRSLRNNFERSDLGIFVCSEPNCTNDMMQSLRQFACEAYGKQKPIIVGGCHRLPTFLVNEASALLIPHPGTNHWVNCINSLLLYPYKREQMGQLGYRELQAEIDSLSILRDLEILHCIGVGLRSKADSNKQWYQLK